MYINGDTHSMYVNIYTWPYYKEVVVTLTISGLILLCSMWSSSLIRGTIHSWVLTQSCSSCSSITTMAAVSYDGGGRKQQLMSGNYEMCLNKHNRSSTVCRLYNCGARSHVHVHTLHLHAWLNGICKDAMNVTANNVLH